MVLPLGSGGSTDRPAPDAGSNRVKLAGRLLKAWREKKAPYHEELGYYKTLAECGHLLNASVSLLSLLEAGERRPSQKTALENLQQAYELKPRILGALQLLYGTPGVVVENTPDKIQMWLQIVRDIFDTWEKHPTTFSLGDIDELMTEMTPVLQAYPTEHLYLLAQMHLAKESYQEASKFLEQALTAREGEPTSKVERRMLQHFRAKALFSYADTTLEAKCNQAVLTELQSQLSEGPDPGKLSRLAHIQAWRQEMLEFYQQAEQQLEVLLTEEPQYDHAYCLMGRTKVKLGSLMPPKKQKAYFQTALAYLQAFQETTDPNHDSLKDRKDSMIWEAMAWLYLKDYTQARNVLRNALCADSQFAYAYYYLAWWQVLQTPDPDPALQALREAIRWDRSLAQLAAQSPEFFPLRQQLHQAGRHFEDELAIPLAQQATRPFDLKVRFEQLQAYFQSKK